MKTILARPRLLTSVLILSLCGTASTGYGQALLKSSPKPVENVTAPGLPRQKILSECNIPVGDLQFSVGYLQELLASEGYAELNILFGPDTTALSVPTLTLRNVTASDALLLIATAAGCEAEPIVGESQRTIGYMLRLLPKSNFNPLQRSPVTSTRGMGISILGSAPGATPPRPSRNSATAGGLADRPGGWPETTTGQGADPFAAGVGPVDPAAPPAGSGGISAFGGGDIYGAVGGAEAMYGMAPSGAPLTRVYPLSQITTQIKFNEIEATLMEILADAGIKPGVAKIAMHEKTNVLVVRSTDEVHDLVKQLLESLTRNVTEGRAGKYSGEIQQLKLQLETEAIKRLQLEQSLDSARQEARKYQQQLREQQDKVPAKP